MANIPEQQNPQPGKNFNVAATRIIAMKPPFFRFMQFAVLSMLFLYTGLSYAGYSLSTSSTSSGGGTWGAILNLSASISGSQITFTARKTSGTFSSSGTMYIKVGTFESYGVNRNSGSISSGGSSISFSHDLDAYAGQYPKDFYARYETSAGYAWVGPITVNYSAPAPTTPSTPSAPSVTATGATSLSISWSPVSGATLYTLFRSTSPSSGYIQMNCNSTTNYTDSGTHLSPGTTYYYMVRAGNSTSSCSVGSSAGWSNYSSYNSATTPTALSSVPATPSAPSVTATGPTSLSISWSPVSGATLYTLFRSTSPSSGYIQMNCNSTTNYTDSGTHLSPGTTYYYMVRAGDSTSSCSVGSTAGWSNYSSYNSATTPTALSSVPATPGAPSVTATGPTSLSISWSPVSGATLYTLFRSTSPSSGYIQMNCNSTTNYTDSGTHLSPGTTYYYMVRAGDSTSSCSVGSTAGWSNLSFPGADKTQPVPVPPSAPTINHPINATVGQPVSVTVTRGMHAYNSPVNVKCTASNSNYTDANLYWSGAAAGGSIASATFIFAVPGQQTIECTSFVGGLSSATTSLSINVLSIVGAPSSPLISNVSVPVRVILNQPVSINIDRGTINPGGGDVKVECSADDATPAPYISDFAVGGSTATATFTFTATGIKNIYCVSYDRVGRGSASVTRTITVSLATPILSKPGIGSNVKAGNAITFTWNKVEGATRYRFFASKSIDVLKKLSATTPVCSGCYEPPTVTDVQHIIPLPANLPEGTYYWMVRAGNNNAGSENSAIWSVNVVAPVKVVSETNTSSGGPRPSSEVALTTPTKQCRPVDAETPNDVCTGWCSYSLLRYVALSRHVYGEVEMPTGWKVLWDSNTGNSSVWHWIRNQYSGFHAILYENIFSKERVLAFEGTNFESDKLRDLILTDVAQFVIYWPTAQYRAARDMVLDLKKAFSQEKPQFPFDKLVLTGHSLGGGLAQYVSTIYGMKAYTFNSAGLVAGSAIWADAHGLYEGTLSASGITHIRSSNIDKGIDLVSAIGYLHGRILLLNEDNIDWRLIGDRALHNIDVMYSVMSENAIRYDQTYTPIFLRNIESKLSLKSPVAVIQSGADVSDALVKYDIPNGQLYIRIHDSAVYYAITESPFDSNPDNKNFRLYSNSLADANNKICNLTDR